MYLRDYLQQLFLSIKNADPSNIKITVNNINTYLNVPSKRFEAHLKDEDIISYLMEWQLVDHRVDGLRLDFINAEDEDELNDIKLQNIQFRLPGYSTIYQFLVGEAREENCIPAMKEAILSITATIEQLCRKNNRDSLIKTQLAELEIKKHDQLLEINSNDTIDHSQAIKQQVALNALVDVKSLPDTYEVLPGFFWTTVDYIGENPGKIILGMLLTSVLIAGITLIALGSCGMGLVGLCAAGTAILGAGMTGASVCGYGGLLGYSLFSNSENKPLIVEDPMNRLELYAVTI